MVDWEHFYNRLRTPDFLPGYEIQNRLGGGAFGDVYKARKVSIGKVYAVKFLKVTEGDVAERELEQVSYFASIDHPNLVTVEDVGVVMGVPYVLMGYAGEDTLARRLQREEMDGEAMLGFFVQACRGVLALHDRRLAHFDLKPSNIFLKGDVARVGDYGLAKLLADGRQTLSFGRGTPHYMAPEMLRNRADHRADIYSLGIILYEGIAGELPFGLGEGRVVREDDIPPEFPPDFPVALRPVVERATRLDAEQRYWSVLDLLRDMGQTARQGDSVRVAVLDSDTPLVVTPDTPTGPGGEVLPNGDESVSELRRTAAELARGAVGVARGMWDGVRTRSSEVFGGSSTVTAEDEEKAHAADAAAAGDGEVVSLQTMADDAEEPAKPRTPMLAMLARERQRRSGDPQENGENGAVAVRASSFSPWNQLPVVSAPSVGRTVPVPPAVDSLLGSVASTVVLGFEVMVALVTGPIFYVLRNVGRGADRTLRSVPGALGSTLKLALFLLTLALLGAAFALVVLFLVLD